MLWTFDIGKVRPQGCFSPLEVCLGSEEEVLLLDE